MAEYFIAANSFAAPLFSDSSTGFVEAATPREALEKFAQDYKHPCGLYAANAYASADAYHKGEPHLAQWLCNQARRIKEITADMDGYSMCGDSPGAVEINGVRHRIKDPKGGSVVE